MKQHGSQNAPKMEPKLSQIDQKSAQNDLLEAILIKSTFRKPFSPFLVPFWPPFWEHFGIKNRSKNEAFSRSYFWSLVWWFWRPFCHHFGDIFDTVDGLFAKRRRSWFSKDLLCEIMVFRRLAAPKSIQISIKNAIKNVLRCLIEMSSILEPFWLHFGIQNRSKNRAKNMVDFWGKHGAKKAPKINLS